MHRYAIETEQFYALSLRDLETGCYTLTRVSGKVYVKNKTEVSGVVNIQIRSGK